MEMQREAESASPAAMEAAPAVADVKPEDAGDANCEGASGVVGAVPPALDASTGATGDVEEAEAESGGNEVAGDVKAEAAAARTCSLCSAKKPIAGGACCDSAWRSAPGVNLTACLGGAGCANNACKKCCLAHSDDCPVHQKSKKNDLKAASKEALGCTRVIAFFTTNVLVAVTSAGEPASAGPDQGQEGRAQARVQGEQFRMYVAVDSSEASCCRTQRMMLRFRLADYQETVTIFCVRDFFGSKKLSQGILNDQTRSQRVSGSYLGKQPKRVKGVKSPELKAAIMDVLGKRKRPEGEENAAVARPVPIEAACG